MTIAVTDTDESSALSSRASNATYYGGTNDTDLLGLEQPSGIPIIIKVVDSNRQKGSKIVRRFQLCQITDGETQLVSFEKLRQLIQDGPRTDDQTLDCLYYEDNDGDLVALATTMELNDAIHQARVNQKTNLILHVKVHSLYASFLATVKKAKGYLAFAIHVVTVWVVKVLQVTREILVVQTSEPFALPSHVQLAMICILIPILFLASVWIIAAVSSNQQ